MASPSNAMNITRSFDVPVTKLFQACTEPTALCEWWGGSRDHKITVDVCDVRPGGKFLYWLQRGPDQPIIRGVFVYEDVVPNQELTFISGFADEAGEFTQAFFSPDFPLQIRNTWRFEDLDDGKSRLMLSGTPHNASDTELACFANMVEKMQAGFGGTLTQLEEYFQKA
jgi:uncharacterized protein YndB with AHSA1/START domain